MLLESSTQTPLQMLFEKGHEVSKDIRQKIRDSKVGISCKKDWTPIYKEMAIQKLDKCVTTEKVIPDAIAYDKGKLIAIEIEKKQKLSAVKVKMKAYDDNSLFGYDEVIVIWCTNDGVRQRIWRRTVNTSWLVTFDSGKMKDSQDSLK